MKKLFVFLVLLFALPAQSATYYVDCAASGDGGAGTSTATAWKTIGKVNGRSFSPGDSILFKRGCTWRETLQPSSSGVSGHPITFGAYGSGENPIISGADLITGWALYSGSVWRAMCATDPGMAVIIDNHVGHKQASIAKCVNEYDWFWDSSTVRLYLYAPGNPDTRYTKPGVEVRVRSIAVLYEAEYSIFDGLTGEKATFAAFRATSGGGHCIIRNCIGQYSYVGLGGVWSGSTRHDGSEFYDNVWRYNDTFGMSLTFYMTNCKLYRNECYGNDTFIDANEAYSSGIKIFDDTGRMEGIEIYDNYVHDNGYRTTGVYQGRGAGIWVDAVQPPTGSILIHHNYVENCKANGIFIEISSNCRVWSNVVRNCGVVGGGDGPYTPSGIAVDTRESLHADNNLIYNNTVHGGRAGIKVCSYEQGAGMSISNNIIKNNIVIGQTERRLLAMAGGDNVTYGSGNVYEYNCFGAETTNFIQWGATQKSTYDAWEAAYGGSTYSVRADPQLTNAAGGDLTLRAMSPCIDAGGDLGPSYSTALLPGSSWPNNVRTGDQYKTGQQWEIGAYLFPAAPPPPGSPTPTPTPTITRTPTPTPTSTAVPTARRIRKHLRPAWP
jgi:hypothetical protein